MEIEIVTTKKKLSMSIVKQMKMASIAEIKFAMMDPVNRVLGYVNAFKWNKLDIQIAIIHTGNDWALVPMYETVLKEHVQREQHPDGLEYHTHEVKYYYSDQKVGNIHRTSKKSTDKEHVENCVKITNDLIKFAKGLHIYL
ncbi:hypothetical protein CkP1_0106 [Citrobacter phage CkP1]|nr:hypothetical protein CkP1_0106 [Citrobacter phage CkP1]